MKMKFNQLRYDRNGKGVSVKKQAAVSKEDLTASMHACIFILLLGVADGQVFQGCYLKTDPPIALVSSTMDPYLCQQSCQLSPYVMIAPSLSVDSSFECSCAAKIPGTKSGSCIIPCPGDTDPSSAPSCGGFRFSHTSTGWSVYSTDFSVSQEGQQLPSIRFSDSPPVIPQPQSALLEGIPSPDIVSSETASLTAAAKSDTAVTLELATPTATQSGATTTSTSFEEHPVTVDLTISTTVSSTISVNQPFASPTTFPITSTELPTSFSPLSSPVTATVAMKASNSDQQIDASSTPRLIILSLILALLLAAFAWWYLRRSNSSIWLSTSDKELNYLYSFGDDDEEKVLRFVPYTGPVVPLSRDKFKSMHLESVISLDLSDSLAVRETLRSLSVVGQSAISLHF